MQSITMHLDDNEWSKVLRAAQAAWLQAQLDRNMSRAEACRRLLMAGLNSIPNANLSAVERPLQPRGDDEMPQLPIAP